MTPHNIIRKLAIYLRSGIVPASMTPEEEKEKNRANIEEAKAMRLIMQEGAIYSQGRANESSVEFIRLQVQLASLLLALTGIFWNVYYPEGDPSLGNYTKIAFALVLFLLIGSITLGLLYLKIVERHWDSITRNNALRFNKWQKVIRGEATYEQGIAFHEGACEEKGLMIYTPDWPWVIQTILLGVSLAIIFCLAVKLIIVS